MGFNVAIIGAGNIAEKMAYTLSQMKEANAYAVASRDEEKAERFAKKYGMTKYFGSYEEMLRDDKIDLVYVATPHSFHHEHMMLCLRHGKNVICEKPFTVTEEEAREVLDYAAEQHLFVTEAMWIRYLPLAESLKEIIEQKKIGKISMVTANLGYPLTHVPRMVKPELAGGAMLDLGCYPLHFIAMCLGNDVKTIKTHLVPYETGVDAQNVVILEYNDKTLAVAESTMLGLSDRKGILTGENGYIIVENINNFESIQVVDSEYHEIEFIPQPQQISGFEYQILASKKAIESGQIQCPQLPHDEILRMVMLIEKCLQ